MQWDDLTERITHGPGIKPQISCSCNWRSKIFPPWSPPIKSTPAQSSHFPLQTSWSNFNLACHGEYRKWCFSSIEWPRGSLVVKDGFAWPQWSGPMIWWKGKMLPTVVSSTSGPRSRFLLLLKLMPVALPIVNECSMGRLAYSHLWYRSHHSGTAKIGHEEHLKQKQFTLQHSLCKLSEEKSSPCNSKLEAAKNCRLSCNKTMQNPTDRESRRRAKRNINLVK